ncbi:MAG: GntR family transcriptional regulator [Gemmatimonadetes bacterium]|nr:winged helix-turn-helix transcriptional regulator [Gemmatimonadota bacterium]NIQ55497.1 winged helix-turn-helix transcriptional regulator [Gemmatimonadota bacterium]NIU75707.1 GntR family transcriptional regulator [Gammaproteobacteria bacterium]NIX45364.1 GntR family transcriptional regulator [Gemmatimonadota bacterium]NIY09652.1 GntR family transcriptional regulator [Gemmatimonadota bacterium]
MARKAGSIIINRLRDRINLGRYFGCWQPGDRLPSVRAVARLEGVDRKTAAAAYRRLQKEGLVRVEPRSGVYLRGPEPMNGTDPLRRLHQQWLEHTLGSAMELGLDSETVGRMVAGVAAVETRRIPVVDVDPAHAGMLARELSTRTGLQCVPTDPASLPARHGPLKECPFIAATPAGARKLQAIQNRIPLVDVTLAPDLFGEVCDRVHDGDVVVFVGTDALQRELEEALDHGLSSRPERVRIARPRTPAELEQYRDAPVLLLWPGTPEWISRSLNGDALRRPRLLAESTVTAIRSQVARAALDYVNTSTANATR